MDVVFKLSVVPCYGRAELQSELFEVRETPLPMLKAPVELHVDLPQFVLVRFFFNGGGMTHSEWYNSAKVTC